MNEHIDETLLSQLVDGELTAEGQNKLLSELLDDTDARERLKEHLRLRDITGDWRRQEPTGVVTLAHAPAPHAEASWAGRLAPLAAAAVIGGILVAGGFFLAHRDKQPTGTDDRSRVVRRDGAYVSKDQRRQIAQVFRFHESVAGPLRWFAADDGNVLLGTSAGTEAVGRAVAVQLHFGSTSDDRVPEKTYVIVCRENQSVTIEFPEREGTGAAMRLFLMPDARQGVIEMEYAITQEGRSGAAAVAGRRRVGLEPTRLGQLAMGDRLINVDAAAWVIPEETP